MKFIEDMSVEERKRYFEERRKIYEKEQKKALLQTVFDKATKYRCEQVNVTQVDDIPRSNSIIKTQLSLGIESQKRIAKVKLEDYIYNINPSLLNIIFEFIKSTEFIKHNVLLEFDEKGKIEKILNKEEINKQWKTFLNSEKFETDFIRKLRNTNPNILSQIIGLGNKQFASDSKSEEDYRRELFYMVVFDRYLFDSEINNPIEEDFTFLSVLIPGTQIPMRFESNILTTGDSNVLKYKKKGTAFISEEKKKEIKEKYDKYQKPEIKYSFTEYYLDFLLEMDFNKNTKLPINARLELHEGVRHNIESRCHFKLRQLD